MDNLWLIFDVGTSGLKAALVTDQGEIVRSQVEPYRTRSAPGGIVEQNVTEWWQATLAACHALTDHFDHVVGVVVTGQMQDLILLDEDANPTRAAILYSDTRAQAEAAEIIKRFRRKRLRSLTGNDQGADSLWAKLLWVQRHDPEAFRHARMLLFSPADYLALKLTRIAATDTTTASATGLMDLLQRSWLKKAVYDEMGLAPITGLLPALVAGGTQIGRLTGYGAGTLNLRRGIPIFHAPGDAGAATLGAGSGEIGQAYGYLGTSGWVAFSSPDPGSPEQGVFTLAHVRSDQYIPIAPLLTAGGNLDWARELFSLDDYAAPISTALARPITNLLYLPYLNGERAPFTDPLARGAFIGLERSSEHADLFRAVLEGVVYAYRHALDTLLPTPPAALTLTGGGTRSLGWCQLFADILGIPIGIAADAENVGVRGALLSALVTAGVYPDYAPPGYFPLAATLQPNPATGAHYDEKYTLFRAAYPALKPIFRAQGRQFLRDEA